MRTTKQLSKALMLIQDEAMERIKSFFNGQSYVRIIIEPRQRLTIQTGMNLATVTEIHSNGDILYKHGATSVVCRAAQDESLPADALLTILDELERMKKTNQLKKP